jgi:aspartyl protease family protein
MARFLWIYFLAALAALWLAHSALRLQPNRTDPTLAASNQVFSKPTAAHVSISQPAPLSLPIEYVEGRRGAYATQVQLEGRELHMLIDTGASFVSLTKEDAEAIGIRPRASDFTLKMQTANGIASAAPTWLPSLKVGSIEVHDVQAIVMPQGASSVSLLGMSFLERLHRFGVTNGRMVLEQ